jgi:hypothetical protein
MLLDAAEYACISPIRTDRFHGLAYLADVLSPVFDLAPTRGRILKRRKGPYYPDLQEDLDRLVGLGLVNVSDLSVQAEGDRTFLDAYFDVNIGRAAPLLAAVYADADLLKLREFFRSLAEAVGRVDDQEIDEATRSDLTWSGNISGTLIDFAEWRSENLSVNAAEKVTDLAESGLGLPDGLVRPDGSLHLYVSYLRRAVNG